MPALSGALPAPAGLEACFAHTDLRWRLAQIPDSARVVGAYLNMLDDRAEQFGPRVHRSYREFFQLYRFSALRSYPVKDYLIRLCKLAELQFGAPNVYRGLYEIQAGAFPAFRSTLMGRLMFAALGTDFSRVFPMMTRAMDTSLNYARVIITNDRPNHYIARWTNQYVYIEHAMAGALEGIARICNVELDLQIRLDDPFNGDMDVTVLGPRRWGQ
jgi:uncharacterized protein (TIGR02265 family)